MKLIFYGIESALQVNQGRVLNVNGFGPAKANAVVAWRQQVESRFRFDPNPNVADAREKDKINREVALKSDQLRNSLSRGARDLTVATQTVLARSKTADPALTRVHRDRLQAEADDAFVNSPFLHRMKRVNDLAWVILVMAVIGMVADLTHLPNVAPKPSKPLAPIALQPAMERLDPKQTFRVWPGRGVRRVNVRQSPANGFAVLDPYLRGFVH